MRNIYTANWNIGNKNLVDMSRNKEIPVLWVTFRDLIGNP